MPTHADRLLRCVHRIASQANREPDDSVLLTRFLTGRDPAAFEALVARHGPMVLRVCQRVLGNRHDADDAFQATFLILARKAAGVRPPGALAAWLHGVAYRVASGARAAARRRRREQPTPDLDPPDPRPDPLAELTAREALRILEDEVQRLPRAYRLPVVLCCLHGVSQEEAARCLGWTPGSVKGRLERGRKRLHQRLAGRGLGLAVALALVEFSRGTAAGLAPALAASTAKAAVAFAAGGHDGATVASAEIIALARSGLIRAALPRTKLGLLLLLAVGTVAAGSVLSVGQRPAAEPGQAALGAQPPAASSNKQQARVDRYGDPLPPGAVARIGTTRFQGRDGVSVAAFSPDGKLFATGGPSWSKARLWDAKSGKLLLEMPLAVPSKPNYGGSSVTTLAFSPDGKRLAFGGYWSPSVCLWDVEAGKQLHVFDNWAEGWENQAFVEEGPILAFTPDGRTLVGGARDGSVRLWDVETGREQARLTGSDKAVLGMGLSADGKILLTADYDGNAHLWDLAARKRLRSFDTAAGRQHTHRLAPDGQTFAYMTADGVIIVRDTVEGKERHRLQGDAKALRLAYAPDSKALLTARADGVVTAWDVRTGEKRKAAECRLAGPEAAIPPSGPDGAWFAPDGRALAWAVGCTVRLWDLAAGAESPRLEGHRSAVWSVGFSADGRSLVTTSITGEVGGWDPATGAARHPIRAWLSWDPRTRLSADRRRALSVTGETGRTRKPGPGEATVYLWEPFADRPPVRLQGQTGPAYHAAFTPDGRSVIATHHDGTIGVYDAATGKLVRAVKGKEYLYHPTFAPDGATFATLASDSVLRLWDLGTGRELRTFPSPPVACCLAFSPDGKVIATGHGASWELAPGGGMRLPGPGDWLCLWEAASGKQLQRLRTEQHRVNAVEFSTDGRLIATAGGDGTVRLWEAVSGLERRRLKGHREGVNAVAFAPDGWRLASGGFDGTALVWEVFAPGRSDPSEAELAAWWDDLAGEPAKANRAVGALAAARATAAFLAKRVKPVEAPDEQRLARLIADLDGDRFRDREAATKELERLQELAGPMLRQALTAHPSAEARRRIDGLLEQLAKPLRHPESLRAVRAAEVLELAGTPDARRLLQALARGAPAGRLTQEAKASLGRLARRRSFEP
jgi:RNA polymerase sigma factor (sigma-70 family)